VSSIIFWHIFAKGKLSTQTALAPKMLVKFTTGVNFINIFMCGFFELFLRTVKCNLQMATRTAKCNLRMANQHKFHTKKHGEIHFQKQADFLFFLSKSCA
jgi:hypothetical protein